MVSPKLPHIIPRSEVNTHLKFEGWIKAGLDQFVAMQYPFFTVWGGAIALRPNLKYYKTAQIKPSPQMCLIIFKIKFLFKEIKNRLPD